MQSENFVVKKIPVRFFAPLRRLKRMICKKFYCDREATYLHLHQTEPTFCAEHKDPGMVRWEEMGKICVVCISNYINSEKYPYNKNIVVLDTDYWKLHVSHGSFLDEEGKNKYCINHRPEKFTSIRSLCIICTGKFLMDINLKSQKIHFCPLHILTDPII